MRLATKAALLSGLIFPGLGHFLLKHYARGIVFMIATLSVMVWLVMRLTRQATLALERMAADGGPIAIGNLSEAVSASASSGGPSAVILLMLMLAGWIAAVVDAYQLGRRKDRLAQAVFEIPNHCGR